ncbi:MAG: hypothetical protein IPG96_03060 [Proteobacteria bacterium]|nr:hypothetical protein [Pseudomonadota bacterium]
MAGQGGNTMVPLAGWPPAGTSTLISRIDSLEKIPISGAPISVATQRAGVSFVPYAPSIGPAEIMVAAFSGGIAAAADLMWRGKSIGLLVLLKDGTAPIKGFQAVVYGGSTQQDLWTPEIRNAFKQAGAQVLF